MPRAIEFAAYVAARNDLEARQRAASASLKAIPGIGSGAMGLTPDCVKFSPAYREARRAYENATRALQRLNAANVKRFARELREEREARRNRQG